MGIPGYRNMNTSLLSAAAARLAALLEERNNRIVFAESCTAGLVSAALAGVPGVSQWHCGSAVTYRLATKTAWLAIPPAMIEQHGVVSDEVAQLMAAGVLHFTPEADVSAAVTGHLGPNAPQELDGVVHIAIGRRESNGVVVAATNRVQLSAGERGERQQEAAQTVLQFVTQALAE